jgi:glycosyltransferase involved in cell wall biosynthesis
MNPTHPKRLRCAVLCRHFLAAGGGAERYALAVVQELAATHEIHVFAHRFSAPISGVTFHRIPALWIRSGWLNQLWYAGLVWLKTRRGFDVVHSHENTWHGNVQTLHVKTARGNLLGRKPELTRTRALLRVLKLGTSLRLLSYLALERARFKTRAGLHIAVASQQLALDMTQNYPSAVQRLNVITPGVAVPSSSLSQAQARELLGLADAPTLLFVANDYARKGLDALLHALALLPAQVQLIVVGKTTQAASYARRAFEAGVSQRVRFIGTLHDMSLAYRAADALAHPTLEDSYAMVVLEALAHELPVVVSASAFCGIAAELSPQVNALVLDDPKDAQALFDALHEALFDRETIERLRVHGSAFAQARSWQVAGARYAQLYAAAAGRQLAVTAGQAPSAK